MIHGEHERTLSAEQRCHYAITILRCDECPYLHVTITEHAPTTPDPTCARCASLTAGAAPLKRTLTVEAP